MKRCILVTGAAGFLGGRTAKFLAEYFGNTKLLLHPAEIPGHWNSSITIAILYQGIYAILNFANLY